MLSIGKCVLCLFVISIIFLWIFILKTKTVAMFYFFWNVYLRKQDCVLSSEYTSANLWHISLSQLLLSSVWQNSMKNESRAQRWCSKWVIVKRGIWNVCLLFSNSCHASYVYEWRRIENEKERKSIQIYLYVLADDEAVKFPSAYTEWNVALKEHFVSNSRERKQTKCITLGR